MILRSFPSPLQPLKKTENPGAGRKRVAVCWKKSTDFFLVLVAERGLTPAVMYAHIPANVVFHRFLNAEIADEILQRLGANDTVLACTLFVFACNNDGTFVIIVVVVNPMEEC